MQQQQQQQQPGAAATVCIFMFMHVIEVFFKVLNLDFCKYTTINVTQISWCHHSTVFVCNTRTHIHTQRKHLINISALLMDDCFILQYSPAMLAPVEVHSFMFICVCSYVHLIMLMITTG